MRWPPLLLLLLAAVPVRAEPPVEQLLERAFRHPRSVAHTGTLTVNIITGAPGTAALVRVACDGRGRELREHLSGPAQGLSVLTDGQKSWQRARGERLWTALQTPPQDKRAWARLRGNYTFRKQGGERIAGRDAVAVEIIPVHAGNPRQVLHLDAATALVLRTDSYSSSGELVMKTAYQTLLPGAPRRGSLDHPEAKEVAPPLTSEFWAGCSSPEEIRRKAGQTVPLPTRLPPGYALVAFQLRACRRGDSLPVVRYEDGLNALTLFVTPGAGGRRGPGWRRGWGWGRGRGQGACIRSRMDGQQVSSTTHGGCTYVLVGDHSPDGLEDALRSIE